MVTCLLETVSLKMRANSQKTSFHNHLNFKCFTFIFMSQFTSESFSTFIYETATFVRVKRFLWYRTQFYSTRQNSGEFSSWFIFFFQLFYFVLLFCFLPQDERGEFFASYASFVIARRASGCRQRQQPWQWRALPACAHATAIELIQ